MEMTPKLTRTQPARGRTHYLLVAAAAVVAMTPGRLVQADAQPPAGLVDAIGHTLVTLAQEGVVSWYGAAFHNRQTASGETFDKGALTMAHRSLPFGTRVRVTNLTNGRSVVVRVNDRGPYVGHRIADLSQAAADEIGMMGRGIASARIEVLVETVGGSLQPIVGNFKLITGFVD
jgi:rare lipoprotein A